MKLSAALIFALLALTGCGQKGALFMPEQPAGQPQEPAREALTQQPTED